MISSPGWMYSNRAIDKLRKSCVLNTINQHLMNWSINVGLRWWAKDHFFWRSIDILRHSAHTIIEQLGGSLSNRVACAKLNIGRWKVSCDASGCELLSTEIPDGHLRIYYGFESLATAGIIEVNLSLLQGWKLLSYSIDIESFGHYESADLYDSYETSSTAAGETRL